MQLDVRSDHLAIVRAILKKFVPNLCVVAFGSRVIGAARETSDLDLCIKGSEPLSFNTLANLRDAFSESNLPYKVDVVDWSVIDDSFKEIIAKNEIDLQQATSAR
jgi:predicted nucleotidyltransferase